MSALVVHSANGVCTLTLNRPECRNALSRSLIDTLTAALQAAGADAAIRAIVLAGNGPSFCAGLDLREIAQAAPDQAEHDASRLLTLFETLDNTPQPVIAAVNGPAVAGGAGLVSVCDLVICGQNASIGYPEIKRGLVAAIVMTYLRRLVGERQAKYLLLTGESLSAQQAVDWGLATEVAPGPDALPRALEFAAKLAEYPPQALANTKQLMNRIRSLQHAEAVQKARALNASMRLTAESRAGVNQFLGRG